MVSTAKESKRRAATMMSKNLHLIWVAKSNDRCNSNSDRQSEEAIDPGYFLLTWI